MKKVIQGLIMLAVIGSVQAATVKPATIEQFIPEGWKQIALAQGDLNGDHVSDAVLIIQQTNPENIKQNNSLGSDELNLNPRKLLVLFRQADQYHLQLENTKIPRENNEESPCLADPLENHELAVKNGVLQLSLSYWLSCGGWGSSTDTYQFRWQNQQMQLIGYDSHSFSRASGEAEEVSINFLTHKKKVTTGLNEFDDQPTKPSVRWQALKPAPVYTLDTFNFAEPPSF